MERKIRFSRAPARRTGSRARDGHGWEKLGELRAGASLAGRQGHAWELARDAGRGREAAPAGRSSMADGDGASATGVQGAMENSPRA
jgi:hypothetical protein